jgi:hypothetical protein
MPLHTEVEATKTIARQAISTTLENNSFRLIVSHYGLNNRLENRLVCCIVNAISEWEIDSIVLARANADVAKLTSTREVFAVLVERHGHNSIGGIERFLNTITVVDVNVDVQNPLLEPEELNDAEDDI